MPDEARFGAQARFVNRAFLKRLRKSRSGSLKQGPLATTGRSCVALGASWVDLGLLLAATLCSRNAFQANEKQRKRVTPGRS